VPAPAHGMGAGGGRKPSVFGATLSAQQHVVFERGSRAKQDTGPVVIEAQGTAGAVAGDPIREVAALFDAGARPEGPGPVGSIPLHHQGRWETW